LRADDHRPRPGGDRGTGAGGAHIFACARGLAASGDAIDLPYTSKASLALAVLAAVVAAAAFKAIPIAYSALLGVGILMVTRVIDWKDVGAALSTRVVMLIVASLALRSALTVTGGTDYIAQLFLARAEGLPPQVVLGLLMLMMALLTNFVSNTAAAAIGIADTVGANFC
jgi:di/tricarboxylate transporter